MYAPSVIPSAVTTHNAGRDEGGAPGTAFVRDTLRMASERGCGIHEETQPSMLGLLLRDDSQLSRFTIILPDGRLVSSALFEERAAALIRVCTAAAPYIAQFEPQNRLTP